MHSMPRTFLVRRGEPTSGRNDSYQPGNRKHCLSDAVAETGDSMMPGTRIFGEYHSLTVKDQTRSAKYHSWF